MEYHDLPIKNNDSQFLETRGFQVVDIARIFRVPPHLVGDLTRGLAARGGAGVSGCRVTITGFGL